MRKIQIQRLQRRIPRDGSRCRTSRACDLCRKRKTKCDGNKPTCAQCRGLGVSECVYSESKVVTDRKQLESALSKLESYEDLLRDISSEVDGPTSRKIASFLKETSVKQSERARSSSPARSSSSSVGSLSGLDTVSEDFNRNEESRATGYLGKNSEISWMQRLNSETAKQNRDRGSWGNNPQVRRPSDASISSMSYHLDSHCLADPDVENSFELPSKALADRLFNTYIERVHYFLPIIRLDLFSGQYRRVFSGEAVNPGKKWLAILNIIFAISGKFCQISGQKMHNETSPDIFFARAKSLNVSENVVYQHDDLQQVQAEALMAFYFLTVSQVNRSWKMVGIAARAGIALGLNLRQTNDDFDMASIEARKRLWWSIVYLEHVLSIMTGRVSCLTNGSSSAIPPLPFESFKYGTFDMGQSTHSPPQTLDMQWTLYQRDEQVKTQRTLLKSLAPSASLHFFYLADLALITHAITNQVYSPEIVENDWHMIESRLAFYSKKLDQWNADLNLSMAFEDSHGNLFPWGRSKYQVSLALHYYSARVVLNRPCLTRRHTERRSGPRFHGADFGSNTNLACVRASTALISVLPNQPDMAWGCDIAPWWRFVQFLMQANIILLRFMSVDAGDFAKTAERHEVALDTSKKALRWLHFLGNTDAAARKAFELCYSYIQRVASCKHLDLSNVPSPTTLPQAPMTLDHSQPRTLEQTMIDGEDLELLEQMFLENDLYGDAVGNVLLRELM